MTHDWTFNRVRFYFDKELKSSGWWKKFNTPIFDDYTGRETLSSSNECEIYEGIHINSEFMLVEILDENNNPILDNQKNA